MLEDHRGQQQKEKIYCGR